MVAVTDYFPNKDGYICDGNVIGFCYADDTTMTAGAFVTVGSTQAKYVGVAVTAAEGDAIGMCLRTPGAVGDIIPVAFRGVVKATASGTITIGQLVSNSGTTVTAVVTAMSELTSVNLMCNSGTARIVGTAMQSSTAQQADEVLVMLGRYY